MKLISILSLSIFFLVSCGAKGGSSSDNSKKGETVEPVKACSILIKRGDSPVVIARKAFQMQAECDIETEEELVKKLRKFDR